MIVICPQCRKPTEKPCRAVNRAAAIGAPIYCGRTCAGLARRNPSKLTGDDAKAAKRIYDRARRDALGDDLLAKKRKAYHAAVAANPEPIRQRERAYRQANMQRHVEYCRRPEYREKKIVYDRQRRAKIFYGPFAESFLTLLELEDEIASRASRVEIYAQNGTTNKSLKRKREYEKAIGC